MAQLTFRPFSADPTPEGDGFRHLYENINNVRVIRFATVPMVIDGQTYGVITAEIDPTTLPDTLPFGWQLYSGNFLYKETNNLDDLRYRGVDIRLKADDPNDAEVTVSDSAAACANVSGYRNGPYLLADPDDRTFLTRAKGRTYGEVQKVARYEVRTNASISEGHALNSPIRGGSLAAFKSQLGINRASSLYKKWNEEIAIEEGTAKPATKHVPGVRVIEWGETETKRIDKFECWKDAVAINVKIEKRTGRIGGDGLECSTVGKESIEAVGVVFSLGVDRSGPRPILIDQPRWPKQLGVVNPLLGTHVCDRQPDSLIFWKSIAGWHGVFCLHMHQTDSRYGYIMRQYMIPVFADREDMDYGQHPLTLRSLSKKVADHVRALPFGPSALSYFMAQLPRELAKAKGPISDTEEYGLETPPTGHLIRQACDARNDGTLYDSSYWSTRSKQALSLYRVIEACVCGDKHSRSQIAAFYSSGTKTEIAKSRRKPGSNWRVLDKEHVKAEPAETVQPVARLRCLEI